MFNKNERRDVRAIPQGFTANPKKASAYRFIDTPKTCKMYDLVRVPNAEEREEERIAWDPMVSCRWLPDTCVACFAFLHSVPA